MNNYSKPAKDLAELTTSLEKQQLNIPDKKLFYSCVKWVGYCRLQRYWSVLQDGEKLTSSSHFVKNIAFPGFLEIYNFDSNLRLLLWEAISRIEVAIRANIVYALIQDEGLSPRAYIRREKIAPKAAKTVFQRWKTNVRNDWQKGFRNERWVREIVLENDVHYTDYIRKRELDEKCKEPKLRLPQIWYAVDTWDFSRCSTLFCFMDNRIRKHISADYRINSNVLCNWLKILVNTRNKCAHHALLWNHHLDTPIIKSHAKHDNLADVNNIPQTRNTIYGCLSITIYMMDIIEAALGIEERWSARMIKLWKEEFPQTFEEELEKLGFFKNWREAKHLFSNTLKDRG